MYKGHTFLCVILARGGSKGLPNKNLRLLKGKPLIYYTVDAILKADLFERIILSTDSEEIAEKARAFGAEVPFLRPKELADENSCALDAVAHALKWVEANDRRYDYVQYIFPTAPLRTAEDIRKGVELLFEKNADMIMSVCETSHPAWWSNVLPDDLSLRGFAKPEFRRKNRQELPPTYRVNGSIYVAKWDVFAEKKDWYEQNIYAYVMPQKRSVDIDCALDLKMAELLIEEQDNRYLTTYTIHHAKTIREAFGQESLSRHKFVLVVDDDENVSGIVTAGDFRRALWCGSVSLDDSIGSVANNDYTYFSEDYKESEIKEIFSTTLIAQIPILRDGKLVHIVARSEYSEAELSQHKRRLDLPVVIMAGGKGDRLVPLTNILPKALIPIGDKPVIELIMDEYKKHGMDQFVISVHHKAKLLEAYFQDHDKGYAIDFLQEETPKGTAGALKGLEGKIQSPFFVSNCDIIIDDNYSEVYEFHKGGKYSLTIVACMKSYTIPYGICEIEDGGSLHALREKPEYNFFANTGMYLLEPDILSLIPENEAFDMTDLIAAIQEDKKRVGVYPVAAESWIDTGQWTEYREAVKKMGVEVVPL